MANLAIKGHPTRGRDVIEILEMLGGLNVKNYKGNGHSWYYIIMNNYIDWCHECIPESNFISFTLEEFLEKFPYKVGDKVYIKVDPNANCLGSEKIYGEIESAVWVEKFGNVVYKLKDCSGRFYMDELHPCEEEEVSMEDNKLPSKNYEETQSKRDMEKTMFMLGHKLVPNKVYNNLEYEITDGYKFDRVENGKIILKPINPKYPKTYEECCKIIDYHLEGTTIIGYEKTLLENFQKLLICRDAYWKIAGEQMGLDESWKPDWNHDTVKYVIFPYQYLYSIDKENYRNTILAFPTAEMRDVFKENFKDLIELCKEFL